MDQISVVKMRIIFVVRIRLHIKNCVFNFTTFDEYILKVSIIESCDTTVQKYSNLPWLY